MFSLLPIYVSFFYYLAWKPFTKNHILLIKSGGIFKKWEFLNNLFSPVK
jgi:hypothetical protein